MRTESAPRVRGGAWRRVLAAGLLGGAAVGAQAQTIFACEPEWAALTRELLPEARLHVATHARQDPHHIEARPALIAQLRSADAAICTGASLEGGWLPTLQERAGNPRAQNGPEGMFYAASAVSLLDPRPGATGNPFAGDVHAEGNPHFHADPARVLLVARAWSGRLQQRFPAQAAAIAQRQTAFEARWRERMSGWAARAAALRGQRVVAQHTGLAYLWAWTGVRQVADLEPKPGLSPTPGHLQRVLESLRAAPPAAIVVLGHQDARPARWLAQQLGGGVPVRTVPATVEDPLQPDALARWVDQVLDALEAR
jgi:zinc/manganese transport system substrate-binding protein